MTYRAIWVLPDGVTPAPGLDLGEVQPGKAASVTRLLENTGDKPLSAVQFTLADDLTGVSVKVGGVALTPKTTYTTGALGIGEAITVEYSRTIPADAAPGLFSAFIQIRALT